MRTKNVTKNTTKYPVLIFAFLLSITICLSGCQTKVSTAGNQNKADVQQITLNLGDEPSTLDPQLAADVVPFRVINSVFEGLFRKDKDGLPVPGVAESCDISEDGLTYTFHLRKASWSDGSPIKSDNFKTAWLRALDPKPANYEPSNMGYLLFCIKGAQEYNSGKGAIGDVAINSSDPKTLIVTLVKPTPYFFDLVCNSVFMPVSNEFYSKQPVENNAIKYGTEASTIMGNGPFIIKEWKHGESITLIKNNKYWNNKAINLSQVTFKMIKDASAALTAFKAGELDVTEIIDDTQRKELQGSENVIAGYDTGGTFYAAFNNQDPVLKNANIRKALAYALDRETLLNKVINDGSTKALGFVDPAIYGKAYSFRKENGDLFKDNNAAEAKDLLAKGTSELNLSKLPKLKLLIEDKETAKRDALVYQDMWRKNLDVDVEIVTMPWDAIQGDLMKGDYQAALLSWSSDYNDPSGFLDIFASDNEMNVYKYSNTNYDNLINNAAAETDKTKRMAYLKDAEKLIIQDMAVCPLYFGQNSYAVKPKVKGFVRNSSAIQNMDLYWTYIGK